MIDSFAKKYIKRKEVDKEVFIMIEILGKKFNQGLLPLKYTNIPTGI